MKRITVTLIMLAGSMSTLLVAPGIARADTLTSQTVPFAATLTNPCNGDVFPFSATFKFDTDAKSDNSGGQHLSIKMSARGSSTTPAIPSGSSYSVSDNRTETLVTKPPYPYLDTLVENYHMISQGAAPNFMLQMRFHITVNANGTPEVLNFDFDTSCT